MSGPAPQSACACPRDDPRMCLRVRYNRDLASLMYAEEPIPFGPDWPIDDDEECECGCHDLGAEDNEGEP